MKCRAGKGPLREKSAGGMTLDVCYGGCGGVWFDAGEFSRICAEVGTAKITHPAWAIAIAEASACVMKHEQQKPPVG